MAKMVLNETSYFGAGCRKELPAELKKRKMKKAFIVSDADLFKFGVVKTVTDVLDGCGTDYFVFTDVKPNPTIANVHAALDAFNRFSPDVIIAIGGGSAIDTAKAVGVIATNPNFADVKSLEGVAPTENKAFPIIAFATTSGTAAEVTINYVIEGYITPGANPISDLLCWNSIKLISENLRAAVKDGRDIAAREGMAYGSYVAGMAFSNVGLGIVHSMAHPLGARFDVPHGVANALLLPFVMEYNKPACIKKFGDIARAMGVSVIGLTEEEAAQAAIEAVKKLSLDIGIPQKLKDLKKKDSDEPLILPQDLKQLAEDAFIDPCTGGNPRKTSVEEILDLYKIAY